VTISTENSTRAAIDAGVDIAADYLLDQLDCAEPSAERLERTLDCGTVCIRIRVEVEPTGLTAEQVVAAVIAGDENEAPEVRAAARAMLADGAGTDVAREVLARSGPWPSL
jgi:hypothetical protein